MFLHEILHTVRKAEEAFERELKELESLFPSHCYRHRHMHKPIQVLTIFINKTQFIIMDPLNLQAGQQAPIIAQLVDAKTLQPIPGASKVVKSVTTDSDTATVDANGNLVAVKAGTGNLTVVNTWAYTDQNSNEIVTADETTVIGYVIAVTPEGILQVVSLGTSEVTPA
jgi:hypothetical protein